MRRRDMAVVRKGAQKRQRKLSAEKQKRVSGRFGPAASACAAIVSDSTGVVRISSNPTAVRIAIADQSGVEIYRAPPRQPSSSMPAPVTFDGQEYSVTSPRKRLSCGSFRSGRSWRARGAEWSASARYKTHVRHPCRRRYRIRARSRGVSDGVSRTAFDPVRRVAETEDAVSAQHLWNPSSRSRVPSQAGLFPARPPSPRRRAPCRWI
jgi:hypothetical protein